MNTESRMESYRMMERALELQKLDKSLHGIPVMDELLDRMDALWYQLSEEERQQLSQRQAGKV